MDDIIKVQRREGERENNSYWYIKETIERVINEAYRIRRKEDDEKQKQRAKKEWRRREQIKSTTNVSHCLKCDLVALMLD